MFLEVLVLFLTWMPGILAVAALINYLRARPESSVTRALVLLTLFGGTIFIWIPVIPFSLALWLHSAMH
jgi:hypothetical protein